MALMMINSTIIASEIVIRISEMISIYQCIYMSLSL
uniref:Uncharacterized protein n=1 Tax=Rhizophora mucronata TaxID=61149 RepID=A0A2P2PFH3_RHIMU